MLVTGATGKLGNAVARQLHDRGEEVVALVRDPDRATELLPAGVAGAVADVREPATLERACEGVGAVVNCMGIFEQWVADEALFERVNATGARNVVRAAREAGARRVVHTSTYDVFHAETGGTVSEAVVADYAKGTPYERSKQLAERLVLEEAEKGIEVVIVNPAGIYGPGPWAEAGWDAAFRDVLLGRLPAAPPGGLTLVLADDAAATHVAALDRGKPGERYIAADGYIEIREMLCHAVELAGHGRKPLPMPFPVARALAAGGEAISRLTGKPPLLTRDQLHFFAWRARADSTKAQRELGIEFTGWREG
ncbi:MAG: NAD-dependent epimerase/dehydratase family protein, partial [Solirubrobacterales bacterium]